MATSFTSRLGTAPEEGMKAPCVVSTTANITLSGEQTIDGVAVVAGDRVLVRSQTDTTENGIYDAKTGAWTRSTDWNKADDVISGQIVTDANSGIIYQSSFSGTFVLGTTGVSFTGNSIDAPVYFGIAGGTVDVITVALTTTLLAYTTGTEIKVRALGANITTTPTINVDGLGAKTITKLGGTALVPGDIAATNHEIILRYNSTSGNFELVNPQEIGRYLAISGEPAILDYSIEWWNVKRYVPSSGADVYTELQAFFDAVKTAATTAITVKGSFNVSQGLTIDGTLGILRTVDSDFTLQATAAIDTLLDVKDCYETQFRGRVTLLGTGGSSFTSRTCRQGLKLTNSGRAKFDKVFPKYFYQYGANVESGSGENNNLANLGDVRPNSIGTWTNTGATAATFTWSNNVNSGSSGSTSQTTVIEVDNIPSGVIQYGHIEIDSELYLIQAIDTGTPKKLTIYPWLNSGSGSSGSGAYVIGAGVNLDGSDSGICKFNGIDATNCGVGLLTKSLYGAVVDRIVNQSNFIGVSIAARSSQAHATDFIGALYSEDNLYDIVKNATSQSQGVVIATTYALTLSKCIGLTARETGNTLSSAWMGLESMEVSRNGYPHRYVQRPLSSIGSVQTINFALGHTEMFFRGTTGASTYALEIDADLNRLFGYSGVSWTIVEDAGGTLGAITINEPGGGWTVMGGATYTYTPAAGVKAVRIVAFADFNLNDFRIAVFDADN